MAAGNRRKALAPLGDGVIPSYVRLHALRILQQLFFQMRKCAADLQTSISFWNVLSEPAQLRQSKLRVDKAPRQRCSFEFKASCRAVQCGAGA